MNGQVLERKRFEMSKTHPTAERWTPKKPLVPGSIYTWQMAAYDRNRREVALAPARPEHARFQILSLERAEWVSHQTMALNGSHLGRMIFYAREGLLDDADREMSALRKENPGSGIVQSWNESLHVARGIGG